MREIVLHVVLATLIVSTLLLWFVRRQRMAFDRELRRGHGDYSKIRQRRFPWAWHRPGR
jgi:hypothetical protein